VLFNERLKAYRKERGLTQTQLAESVGVAKSTIAGYENGSREPDLYKLIAIAKAFEITVDELLDHPGQKKSPDAESSGDYEKGLSNFYDMLIDMGMLERGQDLTENQLDALKLVFLGISKFISAPPKDG